ncbi:hypothetical protein GE21DRAFT_1331684, partial [Neurospora crassa]
EVSEMLGGRISNQDEDEVEEELAALEAEVAAKNQRVPVQPVPQVPLPNVPDTELSSPLRAEEEERQQRQRQRQEERQAMLA